MNSSPFDLKKAALLFVFWSAVSCGKANPSANRVASANGENILTSSKWSSCVYVLGVGNDYLFEKRDVNFTTDGHLVMEPVSLSMDSECKESISTMDAKKKMGDRASLSGKVILGYRVGSTPDASGHYDFDVLYGADGFGTNEYTKIAIEGDKLRNSSMHLAIASSAAHH